METNEDNRGKKDEQVPSDAGKDGVYGPWMLITRTRRPRRVNQGTTNVTAKEVQENMVQGVDATLGKEGEPTLSNQEASIETEQMSKGSMINVTHQIPERGRSPPNPKEFLTGSQMRKEKAKLGKTPDMMVAAQEISSTADSQPAIIKSTYLKNQHSQINSTQRVK